MIPSVVASEVTGALRDFLTTGFGPSSPELAGVVDDFLADPENLVKGPYLSVALPYRRAPEGASRSRRCRSVSPRTATSAPRSRGLPRARVARPSSPELRPAMEQ